MAKRTSIWKDTMFQTNPVAWALKEEPSIIVQVVKEHNQHDWKTFFEENTTNCMRKTMIFGGSCRKFLGKSTSKEKAIRIAKEFMRDYEFPPIHGSDRAKKWRTH